MSPVTSKRNVTFDWDLFEPVPPLGLQPAGYRQKAETQHDEQPFTCTVEAFEDYWGTYVSNDDSPHDLNDLETFFDGFDVEDELMHSKCQMFRMKQIEKSLERCP